MDDILTFYDENKGNTSIGKNVREVFIEKYIGNKYDYGFDFTEYELYKPSNITYFIPGKMYTFYYKRESNGPRFPIVLAVKTGENKERGPYLECIDFNKVPLEYRAQILDMYCQKFKGEVCKMWDACEGNQTYVSTNIIGAFGDPKALDAIFDKFVGASYSRFYLSKIERPKLYEMDDWKFIPFYIDDGLDLAKMAKKYAAMASETASEVIHAAIKKFKKAAKKAAKKLK